MDFNGLHFERKLHAWWNTTVCHRRTIEIFGATVVAEIGFVSKWFTYLAQAVLCIQNLLSSFICKLSAACRKSTVPNSQHCCLTARRFSLTRTFGALCGEATLRLSKNIKTF